MGEISEKHPLPQGLELKNSYCDLTPGSAKVNLMIENTTSKNITIPAKAIVCQLNLAKKFQNYCCPYVNLKISQKNLILDLTIFPQVM